MSRAFYRQQVDAARRIGQPIRLHIVREDHPTRPGEIAHCGVQLDDGSRLPTILLDNMPPYPPHGTCWCPACIGGLAGKLGMLDHLARLMGGIETNRAQEGSP